MTGYKYLDLITWHGDQRDKSIIERLKKRLQILYIGYAKKLDTYSCGKYLAEYINADMTSLKNEFNAIMDKLTEIDPDCPNSRL